MKPRDWLAVAALWAVFCAYVFVQQDDASAALRDAELTIAGNT